MCVSNEQAKLTIPKFDGTSKSFSVWRQQFMAYAIKKGYTNLINKCEESIQSQTDVNIAANEKSKNLELYADLILLMNTENVRLLSNQRIHVE